jgi:hypothetical protein
MMKNPGSYILGVYFRFSLLRQALWAVIAMPPVVLLLAVVFHSSESVTRPVGWEQSFFVSPGGIKAKNVDAASSGKYVAAVYEGFSGGENAIYVSVSFNGGVSYMKDIKIAPVNTVIDNNPRVAVAGNGHLFVAWQNHVVTEATNRMFYSRSTDMGATWSEPRQINIGTEIEMLPRVFYDDRNRLHLFYNAFAEGAFTLFHAESADESTFVTINSILRLTPDMKGAFFPAIHFSGNNIFLVWQGKGKRYTDDLFLIESSNYGKTWSSIDQITRALSSNTSPSIIMKGDTLYLAYQNNDSKRWAIKMLIRVGGRWSPEPVVISQTEANCYSPALAFSREDELLVTWYDTRDGKTRIFSRRFDMLKGSLLDEQRISTREDAALSPRVVSSGSKAVVFWESGSRIESKYTDVYVAPPKVMSQTHPDGVWTRNSTARIEWTPPEDESGIVGYASIVTRPTGEGIMPDVNPTVQNYSAVTRRVVLPELTDGITYFHIRAIDGAGNMRRTIHYRIQVSAHPLPRPVVVSPTHPQGKSEKEAAPRWSGPWRTWSA